MTRPCRTKGLAPSLELDVAAAAHPGTDGSEIRPSPDDSLVPPVNRRNRELATAAIAQPEGNSRLTLTVAEAAGLLGISSDLAYELVARRELPALRLGRRIVVPRVAVEAILERAIGGD